MQGFKTNLLPDHGQVFYLADVLEPAAQQDYFQQLLSQVRWQQEVIHMFGRQIQLKRQVAWYADAGLSYRYAGQTKQPESWIPVLTMLKQAIEAHLQLTFNACLLNYSANGSQGMGWHSDDEPEIEPDSPIASVSLGAERRFAFRSKDKSAVIEQWLAPGSVLLMQGQTQRYWQHQLMLNRRIKAPRINLTFRQMKCRS